MGEIGELELPPAALDCLIDELGGKKAVAEMTGRKARMVRTADGRRFVYESRARPESNELDQLNVQERNAFMDGKKLVAMGLGSENQGSQNRTTGTLYLDARFLRVYGVSLNTIYITP